MKNSKSDQIKFAEGLRELADEVEKGKVQHFYLCYLDENGQPLASMYGGVIASLGMLELCKHSLLNPDSAAKADDHDDTYNFLKGLADFYD